MTDERAALTIADAARATGSDRGSIRRQLHADVFPGAFKDAQGFWRIPADDLRAAGLACSGSPSRITLAPTPDPNPTAPAADITAEPQIAVLQAEIAVQQHRAEKAEALLAAERRLSEELATALALERHTVEVLLERLGGDRRDEPEVRIPPPGPRLNWQAGLRAARARQLQERAERDRGTG